MMIRHLALSALIALIPALSAGQEFRFAYPAPAPAAYTESRNVTVDESAARPIRMDVYRPAGGGQHPTLIFFNIATGEQRAHPFYVAWARLAASKGITAILPDLGMDTFVQDFVTLHEFIAKGRAEAQGVDRNAVALYAGSGNVFRALPVVQDRRTTLIKSAVLYYGAAEVTTFRPDLPLLFVRAGLDRPALNTSIDGLVARALAQNTPVSVINHAGGRHAFEMVNDDDATREVMDRTIVFVKETTSAGYQAAFTASIAEARAAGHVSAGRTREAAEAYAALVAARPADNGLRLAYGEALLANRQFAEACGELNGLKGKGLGYRDLGIPAAKACLQKGDAEVAIAWLESIPARFRPASLADDPVFAPLRERADFKALFGR
jgi:dienelactone hydrolase